MEKNIVHAVAIPDKEYELGLKAAKKAGRIGFYSVDKRGIRNRFYMENDKLMAEKRNENNDIIKQEVMPMSEAMKHKEAQEAVQKVSDPFRAYIKDRMIKDFPDLSGDALEANIDIVCEANDTIKRLISKGTPVEVAYKLVSGILHSNEATEAVINGLKSKKEEASVETEE
jgi:hypothetical protein